MAKSGTDWLKAQAKLITEGSDLEVSEEEAAAIEVEAWLQRHGVEYAPPTQIPMSLIDEKRSRSNQARRDAIVPDSVERYAASLRAGAVFPPVVVFPSGGKLVIIDGNNRQAAHRKVNRGSISGIVIAEDTPSELIQLLTVEANASHGLTPDVSWRLQQAFHLVSIGFTDPQAAEACAITVPQLKTARFAYEADQRARALKVSGFSSLPATSKQAIGTLKDEAVFFQAAKVAVSTAMSGDEVREMIRQVKTQTSEAARIAVIGEIANERGIQAATKKVMGKSAARVSSPKHDLVSSIGKLVRVDEAALVRQIVTQKDRDLILVRIKKLGEKLQALQVAVETIGGLEDDGDE